MSDNKDPQIPYVMQELSNIKEVLWRIEDLLGKVVSALDERSVDQENHV